MILGIDFDNTLACYDGLFHAEAVRRGLLDATTSIDKNSVRQALVEKGFEEEFTILQGHIYGPGILQAPVYQGVMNCLQSLKKQGVRLVIISHKTPFPYLGPAYDLHASARNWLEENGFYANNLMDRQDVFFEVAVESKLQRIAQQNCTHFIDDLPKILQHPLFPEQTKALLFDPHAFEHVSSATFLTWESMEQSLIQDLLQK